MVKLFATIRTALGFLLLVMLAAPVFGQAEAQISVDVKPRTVREGGSVRVVIEVRGADASSARIAGRPPQGDKLSPAGGFNTSQQVSWINGRKSASTTFQVVYLATGRGIGSIPAFTVSIDGKNRKTKPVEVKILPPAAPGEDPDESGVSVSARLNRSKVYIGESLVLEYILRARVRVLESEATRLEQPTGFIVEDQPVPPDGAPRTVTDDQGLSSIEYTLLQRTLVPTRTGMLEIPSAVFTFGVRSNNQRRQSIFFAPRLERVSRFVPARTIEVLPLPEKDRPDDFTGAVGRFKLEAALGSTDAVAGQAVNLVVTLRGEGLLGAISPPLLDLPPDIQVYDPLEEGAGQKARRWVFPLVPRAAGSLEISRVHMSAFNPRTARYESLEKGPFSLDVAAGRDDAGQTGLASVGGALPVRAQTTDLRFIHPVPDQLGTTVSARANPALFWSAALIPLIALPLLFVGGEALGRWSGSAAGRRARSVRQVSALLRNARHQAGGDADEAAREILRAIHIWASELLGKPSRPLERTQLRRALEECTSDREFAEKVVGLIDRAEGVRYGGTAQGDLITALIDETQALVSRRRAR